MAGWGWGWGVLKLPAKRRSAATAVIRPLAWEPPYAMGVALEKTKKKKKTQTNKKMTTSSRHA